MTSGLINSSKALEFILAGKAFVTFVNTQTQNRFTYKVVKHKKLDFFYVNVLTSPDVYVYIGTITSDCRFKHSLKSHITSDAQSVKVFNYVFNKVKTIINDGFTSSDGSYILPQTALPSFIEIYHSGRCGKCGKRLTVPESIDSGFGPECFKMIADKQMIRDKKLNQLLKLI